MRGRAAAALIALALAAAATILALVLFLREDVPAESPSGSPPAPDAPARAAPIPLDAAGAPDREPPAQAGEDRTKYAGSGIIRGEVLVRDGASVPQEWSLILRPHPWLQGKEHAASRRIDFTQGEATFAVEDLPLGGYLVEARARGLNCLPGNVLLVRGSADQFVSLQLSPGGSIDGGVLDAAGRPAEGLDVTLESLETGERRTVSTDAAGMFLFHDVLDGTYHLVFGRPDSPLLPPETLAFQAPSMRFPTRTLPNSASLTVRVVDVALRPLTGARISGTAPMGSAVDTTSDDRGVARARWLLPGRYRIDGRSAEGLLEGSVAFDLAAGKDVELDLILRDRNRRE